jgi:hypothetical protein
MRSRDYSFPSVSLLTEVIVFMEIVVYAANGLLKLMSENPLLIEIEVHLSN